MNTLYITSTGRVLLDENNNPCSLERTREGINNVFYIKEDTKVIYKKGEENITLDAKAGDILVSFYENEFPNKVIVVNNKEWQENLTKYEEWEQKRKEEWAAAKNAECGDCEAKCADY